MPINVRAVIVTAIIPLLLYANKTMAQSDPKLHVGEAIKVTKVNFSKKGVNAAGDSTVNVNIEYIKPDGSKGMLQMNNVKYATNDSARAVHALSFNKQKS